MEPVEYERNGTAFQIELPPPTMGVLFSCSYSTGTTYGCMRHEMGNCRRNGGKITSRIWDDIVYQCKRASPRRANTGQRLRACPYWPRMQENRGRGDSIAKRCIEKSPLYQVVSKEHGDLSEADGYYTYVYEYIQGTISTGCFSTLYCLCLAGTPTLLGALRAVVEISSHPRAGALAGSGIDPVSKSNSFHPGLFGVVRSPHACGNVRTARCVPHTLPSRHFSTGVAPGADRDRHTPTKDEDRSNRCLEPSQARNGINILPRLPHICKHLLFVRKRVTPTCRQKKVDKFYVAANFRVQVPYCTHTHVVPTSFICRSGGSENSTTSAT